MEEFEFQQTREQLNQCPCPYEKAILSSRCFCKNCQRIYIAEREMATCLAPPAQEYCLTLRDRLNEKARFALKQTHLDGPQPHTKAMKMQCGGLQGLQAILAQETELKPVKNITALVTQAIEQFGDLTHLPYQEIVRFISNYQVRSKKNPQ
jgi:hypothetical protein